MDTHRGEATQDEVPALIRDLYAIVSKLASLFPGRHFTPDRGSGA